MPNPPTRSLTPLEAASAAMRRTVLGSEANGVEKEAITTESNPLDQAPVEANSEICADRTEAVSTVTRDEVTTNTTGQADLSDFIEVSGLLEYDPAAISRIYAGAPQRLIRRVWQTLVPIGLYLLSVGIDWLTRRLANPEHARARAKEAADLVASLGPAFIKAGQALSTRPDIIPPLLL
ncbi:MAG: AarF/ABC1/UbiB kinase family protein, partial [Vulcanococcus sp.]